MATRHLRGVILVTVSALAAASSIACGSSGDGSLFQEVPDASDAATPIYDAGTLSDDDANDGATGDAGPCDPVAASATPPPWTPPRPFASGACAAADFDAFFDACLATPIDPAKCTAYKASSGTCAACLESQETDANLGPVIWHSGHAYFTLNLAGCIANAEKNVSATGCGAVYQAAIGCKQNACESCFTKGSSFAQFSACESAAGRTVCSNSNAALKTSCADALHDAGSPATACLPPATTTTRNAYKQIAPLFCGN